MARGKKKEKNDSAEILVRGGVDRFQLSLISRMEHGLHEEIYSEFFDISERLFFQQRDLSFLENEDALMERIHRSLEHAFEKLIHRGVEEGLRLGRITVFLSYPLIFTREYTLSLSEDEALSEEEFLNLLQSSFLEIEEELKVAFGDVQVEEMHVRTFFLNGYTVDRTSFLKRKGEKKFILSLSFIPERLSQLFLKLRDQYAVNAQLRIVSEDVLKVEFLSAQKKDPFHFIGLHAYHSCIASEHAWERSYALVPQGELTFILDIADRVGVPPKKLQQLFAYGIPEHFSEEFQSRIETHIPESLRTFERQLYDRLLELSAEGFASERFYISSRYPFLEQMLIEHLGDSDYLAQLLGGKGEQIRVQSFTMELLTEGEQGNVLDSPESGFLLSPDFVFLLKALRYLPNPIYIHREYAG